MLQRVEVAAKSLEDYRPIVGDEVIAEIHELAESLQGARVVHINATAFGGGVAEMLYTLVPLMRDVGLDAEWQVIKGTDEFFGAKSDKAKQVIASNQALQKNLETSDLAGTVLYLASDASRFVTGQTIMVDGGTVLL